MDDADGEKSNSTHLRFVREYDFFDKGKNGPRYRYVFSSSAAPKEVIVFPQIIKSNEKIRRNGDDGESLELIHNNPTKKTIRLFGVNIPIDDHHSNVNNNATSSREIQVKKAEFNNNPTKKTIKLFGVNITVDDHHCDYALDANSSTTNSCEIQDTISIDKIETTSSRKRRSENSSSIYEKTTTENTSKERKLIKANLIIQEAPAPPTQLPPSTFHPRILEGIMEHQHPILLFEKKLELSDVLGSHRLLITKSDGEQLMAALTEEERGKVGINKDDFLSVATTDNTHGVEYDLHLKMWPASRAIVLIHQWTKLVTANGLQKGDSVQGWGYRKQDHKFCLALVVINKSN
ncbi:hypothetical protein C2S52_018588 [Perilla frutescens var. hirtella]|nr:hypothetical protein C2S52_018588 [Perilla frutescens var. hirtella]KAH6812269.1 hypothetical protein C2S51_026031 [Perilla frutescens var. frutescens]